MPTNAYTEATANKDSGKETQEDVLQEAKKRFETAFDHDQDMKDSCAEDLRFAFNPEEQWEDYVRLHRDNRPCMSYNLIEPAIDQIVGDQRQSRPAIKIRPTEDGDRALADTMGGLIRNIEAMSGAESVYDQQFKYAVGGGFGAWRVVNEYSNNQSFDQDLFIRTIANPIGQVWIDPNAYMDCKQDMRWAFITEWIPRGEYKTRYPQATLFDWENRRDDLSNWQRGDLINIAEYYRKVPKRRELVQYEDGSVRWRDEVDKLEAGDLVDPNTGEPLQEVNSRTVETFVIEWFKMSGIEVLEGPIKYDWQYIPIVPLYGKYFNIEGKETYKGLTRNAKDPQRSYNYVRSSTVESVALQPKVPWITTEAQIEGHENEWQDSIEKNLPFLTANPDPMVQGPNGNMPYRADTQQIPAAMVTLAQQDAADIRATTGKHEVALGMEGSEVSGTAIQRRRAVGDAGSYEYTDNLNKAIAQTGRILVDQIPGIYDTERVVRILGEDGAEDFVQLNHAVRDPVTDELQHVENDLQAGKYDVRVDTGPSYSTMREEMRETLAGLFPHLPVLQQMALDLFFKNSDFPGASEIHERLRKMMIQQGVIEPGEGEEHLAPNQGPTPEQQLQLRAMLAEVVGKELENAETAENIDKVMAETVETWANSIKLVTDAGATIQDAMLNADSSPATAAGPTGQSGGAAANGSAPAGTNGPAGPGGPQLPPRLQ